MLGSIRALSRHGPPPARNAFNIVPRADFVGYGHLTLRNHNRPRNYLMVASPPRLPSIASQAGLVSFLALAILAGCPAGPSSKPYQGTSDAESRLLGGARRDVYPDDVRKAPEAYRRVTLAWPGVVVSASVDEGRPEFWTVIVEHHYWDWIEDHSIQKARAFLSPRGEGRFVCHAERAAIAVDALKDAMTVAYVRPLRMQGQMIEGACIMRFFPRDWYATDVMDYGRGGEGLRILRVPMQ